MGKGYVSSHWVFERALY